MKKYLAMFLIVFFALPLVLSADNSNYNDKKWNKGGSSGKQAKQPVVINISKSSSGGHNKNYPSQQQKQQQFKQPVYGQVQWNKKSQKSQSTQVNYPNYKQYPKVNAYSIQGQKAAVVVHRNQYTQNYVQKNLLKIGVKVEPKYIINRDEIIHTDKAHSVIQLPHTGFNGKVIAAVAISPKHFNISLVKDHMTLVSNNTWLMKVHNLNMTENIANHYYWHKENGFNYCHYLDSYGYHWYGWYVGNKYFWNRYYQGRWWWYDSASNRWDFWNNGFWWWQDPYHVGELYCYNNNVYVPATSAEDNVVVTAPQNASMHNYNSPDGTRSVKVDNDTMDAFLYDTANPPNFDPIYLASGVKNVQFSDTSSGRQLEIILTLNDGSFDMFDGDGHPFNQGTYEQPENEQNNESEQAPPGNGQMPPQ